jgi:hypothetical protein
VTNYAKIRDLLVGILITFDLKKLKKIIEKIRSEALNLKKT